MQENEIIEGQDFIPDSPRPAEVPVWTVLLTQFGLFILCGGLGVLLYLSVCAIFGWDATLSLHAESVWAERWQVRLQLGIAHFFAFLVSGLLTVLIFYRGSVPSRGSWPDYLKSREWPGMGTIALGILLMAVSVPLVLYSLNLNQQIPLPETLKLAEAEATEALKGLLQMDGFAEFFANIIIIALLPALGEELVFRGVVQQQLMRRIAQPWVAILLSGIIFSAAHFQFEGFLPRMLMGFLLGWLYWKTNNFWVPVCAHFFNNAIQVIGQYLYAKEVSTLDLEKDIQVPWQFAAVSGFMVWAVMRLIRQAQKPSPSP